MMQQEYGTSCSVHFAQKMGPAPLSAFGRSVSRKAPFSGGAPSTRSWVYPYNQHQTPAPTPQQVNVPSPVQEAQPLPNPYPRKEKHRALHVVNATRNDEGLDDSDDAPQANSLGMDFGYHNEPPPPQELLKKKSILGRVFGGVGRTVFSSGKDNRKLKRKATYDSDPTLTTYGGSISAQQNSQTSTSFDDPGPSNLGLRLPHPTTTIPELPESEDAGSLPPDVVRLSDNNMYPSSTQPHSKNAYPRNTRRNPGPSSHFVEGPMTESSHGHNLAERTTVMIYESNPSQYPESRSHGQGHTTTAPAISRQPSSRASPYVNPESTPLQPIRPSSFAPSVARVPVPPIVIDHPVSAAPTRRTSIASPAAAPHSRQQSLNRGVISQSPAARSGLQPPMDPPPPPTFPTATTQPVTSADLQSPVSAHPLPADDYLKMTLSSASNEQQTVMSGTTYSYDPSFSSDLSPFARFFKTLYRMPWVAHDRVTVDYRPDEGLLGAKTKKKKKGKRMTTWYRSVLARSRRSSATIDLLGSVDGRKRNVDVSFGAALAGLGSPFSSTKRRRGRGKENYVKSGRRRHHRHHQQHSRHRHHHSRHNHHDSRRKTTSTDDDADDDDDDITIDSALQRTPLIPAMYPYAPYPSYPIAPGYAAAYPLAPNNTNVSPPLPSPPPAAGTRGMRSMTATAPVYAAAAAAQQGYASYVTQGAPVYVFQPAQGFDAHHHHHYQQQHHDAKMPNGSSVPHVLVPGAVDTEHGAAGGTFS